ncbi:MAG: glycosyl hydrolase [Clostridia bacterium]|nr:glycosyl hydrolase [Clostridia bacterium]
MIGIDLTPYGFNIAGKTYSEVRQFKKELVAYAKAGGIINVSIHFTNPSGIKTDEEYNHCRGSLGNYSRLTQYENVYQALYTAPTSESTKLQRTIYENFNAELELFAEFLGELKYNGVPVLYRPLHEMNGNWFWWGIGQRSFEDKDDDGLMDVDANGVYEVTNTYWINPEYYKNLYRHVYNYFTNTCGLDNILWVYAPDISSNSNYDASTCYPGDEFVDIAGVDWYTDVPRGGALEIDTTGSYNKLFGEGGSATSKIGAITEFGPRNNANYAWLVGQYGSDTGTWGDGLYLGDKQSDYYSCVNFYEDLMALKDKGYSFAYTLSWINQWSVMKMGKGWTFMEKGTLSDLKRLLRDWALRSLSNQKQVKIKLFCALRQSDQTDCQEGNIMLQHWQN